MKDYWKVIGVLVLTIVVFSAVGWVLRPVNKMVERQVLVNSHQYIEGNNQRSATLTANIAEIDAMLVTADDSTRPGLMAKKRALRAMLNATQK